MSTLNKRTLLITAAALLLVACGARYLPALWGVTFNVAERFAWGLPSAMRELPDGSVRVVYHRDADTLVADTYNAAGERVQQQEFPHSLVQSSGGFAQKPLFISDTEFYWIDDTYAHSVRVDLESMTITSLPDIPSLPQDHHFGIREAALLDNGQLVLVGGDYAGEFTYATSHARLLVLNGDTVVMEHSDDSLPFYDRLLPVRGADDFYIQRYAGANQVGRAFHVSGGSVTDAPGLASSFLLFADTQGVWAAHHANAITTLNHISDVPALNWQQEIRSVGDVVPTADGHYLMMEAPLTGVKLRKLDVSGNTLWEAPAPKHALLLNYRERNGRVLVTALWSDATRGARLDESTTPGTWQNVLREKTTVQYYLLDYLTGQTRARFAETSYSALNVWDPATGSLLALLEHTPGICNAVDTVLQDDGDFYAQTHWCSAQQATSNQRHLSFFRPAAQ